MKLSIIHTVLFHLYEVSEVVKFTEAEDIQVVIRELFFCRYTAFAIQDKYVLEICCKT